MTETEGPYRDPAHERFDMQRFGKEILGILASFLAWWAAAVIIGLLMFAIWPPGDSHAAGISLEPQNIPGNAIGFVLALYAFRLVTRKAT